MPSATARRHHVTHSPATYSCRFSSQRILRRGGSSPPMFAPLDYGSLLHPLPVAMREVSSVLKPHFKEPQEWIGIITLGLLRRFAEQIQGGVGCLPERVNLNSLVAGAPR